MKLLSALILLATASCVTPAPEVEKIPVMDPYTRAESVGPGVTELLCPAGFVGYTHADANGEIVHVLGTQTEDGTTYEIIPCEHETTDTDG
jgi:hypothetical protein